MNKIQKYNNNIQKLRIQHGYKSARQFAETHGFNVGTYTNYEQQKILLPLSKAIILADIFECSIDEVVNHKVDFSRKENSLINDNNYILRKYKMLNENDRKSVNKIILALSSIS